MILLFFNDTAGQNRKPEYKKVYQLNYKIEVPVTAGLFAFNYYGFGYY